MASLLMSELGAELDALQIRVDAGDASSATSLLHHRAGRAYFGALREKSFLELKRVEDGPYSRRRYNKALHLAAQTTSHLATVEGLYDLGVFSMRERCEATAAEERAGMILQALADKRAWLQDSKGLSRGKHRAVSDGCVRTGRYKMVDGVRMPVMRVVQ
ncbi:hypothetical protein ABIB06_002438 [Bradyrhizobium sp. LB8.2]|uniref:hypothetical protein n=1 Tax=unclassified Bradyrhizobium TaxID=2631580 RepID=UPI00339A7E00